MNDNKYWDRFFQTGAIEDYLTYTACTSEMTDQNIDNKMNASLVREGGISGRSEYDRYGIVRNASRRL